MGCSVCERVEEAGMRWRECGCEECAKNEHRNVLMSTHTCSHSVSDPVGGVCVWGGGSGWWAR